MNFEVVLTSTDHGFHKRGLGQTPSVALTNAFRKVLKSEMPADREEAIDQIGPQEVGQHFMMVSVSDEFLENPKTLKEEVHDYMLIIRVDKSKETMYTIAGWIRPIF